MKHTLFPRWIPAAWARYRLAVLLLLDALLLLLLAAVIWADNALNRGIEYTPDPQPIAWADGPRIGVNVYNLHLEPDPAVVTRTLQLVRDMGARSVRMQVPWEDIEIHGPGDFEDRRNIETIGVVSSWAKYDHIVDTAHRLGLELVLRIDRPPDWAREVNRSTPFFQEGLLEDPTSTGPPDDFAQYGRFVEIVTRRYRGKVRFFQLWNEPNLATEWNWHTPDPRSFQALLRVGYLAAKAGNPDAVILFPSLSPSDGLDKRAPMTELEYLDQLYEYDGGQFFDIMSVQAYGLGQPPDEHRYVRLRPLDNWHWLRPLDTRTDVSRVVLLREVMERHGDGDKPVWVGEFGWNSAPESIPAERRYIWGEPVSEQQKAAYIIGQVERARQEWPWMGVMHIWKLRHGGYQEPNPDDPTPYFSLVGRDWKLLPAYEAVRAYLAQPAVAGLGAHSWQHPAVEKLPDGWRLRFSGQRAVLVDGLAGDIRVTLDGVETTLERTSVNGQPALATLPATLEPGEHMLEIFAPAAEAPAHFIISRQPPLPLWLWTLLPALLVGMLLVSGTATMQVCLLQAHRIIIRSPPARLGLRAWLATPGGERVLLLGMLLGLLIFYGVTTDLPTRLLGAALFGLLACVRPDLALLFVPLTVPLFFMPKGIWGVDYGLPAQGIRIPLHEMALFAIAGATPLHWLAQHWRRPHSAAAQLLASARQRLTDRAWWLRIAPVLIFVLAGSLGVLIALPDGRGAALREWRWLICEPLLFYALLHYHGSRQAPPPDTAHDSSQPATLAAQAGASPYQVRMLGFLLAGGAFVGLLGILQFLGINLVPYVGDKVTFSADQVVTEGVRRATSVYGHPNNLGLFMGRVWPLSAVLLLAALAAQRAPGTTRRPVNRMGLTPGVLWHLLQRSRAVVFSGVCLLLMAGGLLVSFSKGALLGASVAGLLLAVLLWLRRHPDMQVYRIVLQQRFSWRLVALLAGLLLAGLLLAIGALAALDTRIERLNPFGESSSVRLRLWASALAMLGDHVLLGIGLDQFQSYYQHYIHPSLIGTNEQYTSHPHNVLLDIWLRLGIPGLVVFGWLLTRFYQHSLANFKMSLLQCGLAAAMTAALVHGLVDNFYFVPDLAFTFWLWLWLTE